MYNKNKLELHKKIHYKSRRANVYDIINVRQMMTSKLAFNKVAN